MGEPRIAVVGGGLAGLAAGLACADAGARVTLLEARSRLGGATWSTTLQGLVVDNGQHVFLRCCTAYLDFLARLDVLDRVTLQRRLEVPVLRPGAAPAWLRRNGLPAPLHLAPSLLRYGHLGLRDRLRVARAARRLAALDLADPALDERSFGEWLAEQRQPAAVVDGFWDLIARPTLNLPAREASLALATKVFQTGLLQESGAADIGWARTSLAELHGEPAARALAEAGCDLRLRARVSAIEPGRRRRLAVRVAGERLEADAVVLAAPHDEAAALLPPQAGVDVDGLLALGRAPIVNLHVVFDRPVLSRPFVATVDSPLQWIFDRTDASGLERGQYLAVSLSAAEEYVGVSGAGLRARFEPEFARILPAARGARMERLFVTCERTATFRQAPGTRRLRPGAATKLPGLFLAGAWTDTGWPATMEGAVRSGRAAAAGALRSAAPRDRRVPSTSS